MPSAFLRVSAAGASIAVGNFVSSLGGFLGPFVIGVLKERSGTYASSMAALALGLVLGAFIVLPMRRLIVPRAVTARPRSRRWMRHVALTRGPPSPAVLTTSACDR